MREEGERREWMIWVVSLCRSGEAISVGMLIPVLPVFLEELQFPHLRRVNAWIAARSPSLADALPFLENVTAEGQTAILFCLTGLAMAAVQIVAGRISDAFDTRKPFILAGMLGATLCSAFLVAISTYSGLLIARVVQRIFMGLTFPPMMAIVARHSPPGKGGRVLGTYSTIRLLGFALGPLVGGWVTHRWGHHTTFLTSAGMLLLSVVAVMIWVPDLKEKRSSRHSPYRLPPVAPIFRILGGGIFLMMVGISGVISLFPFYRHEFGATEADLGLCFSAFIGSRCLLQYPSGWLGDRFDKKWVLLGALGLYVPLVALQGFVSSLGQLIALRVGLGVVSAAISASAGGISAERSEPGNRARVMGINTFSFSLGVAVGPLLTGFIPSPALAFAIPSALAVLMFLLVLAMVPPDRIARRAAYGVVAQESPPRAPATQRSSAT